MEMRERLRNPEDLEKLRQALQAERDPSKRRITICAGTGCGAYGCGEIVSALKEELKRRKLQKNVEIKVTGCHGFCERGPLLVINPQKLFYQNVQVDDVPEILSETIEKGNIIDRLLYVNPATDEKIVHEDDVPFYKLQERIIFGKNGLIDPTSIEDYIAIGGYEALGKALFDMSPEEIIESVKRSGLRGRGGGGFPTGLKWESCRKAPGEPRYVICNADEGDPGAYMDRSLLEGNPHSVLEGMIIGAYAIV
jgi:NADH-quinone oxidoreductase subunit F